MERQIKCFPDKVKLKEFIITNPLLYEMLKGFMKNIKTMNIKMTTHNYQQWNLKNKTKQKQTKQTTRTETE